MNTKKYTKAFTLVEMIVVITILSILTTVGYYSMA
jgi:prepilin-type N-terminal cleavage/methylation domain-containing protein